MITSPGPRRLRSIVLIGVVLIGMVGCGSPTNSTKPAAASPATTAGTASGPEVTSVGFTTGGDKCTLGTPASSFAVGVPVRAVLTMSPALPTGGTVKVIAQRDGIEVTDARQSITVTEPAPCIYGTMQDLVAGHYRLTYTISPSEMPPVVGEFDVTP